MCHRCDVSEWFKAVVVTLYYLTHLPLSFITTKRLEDVDPIKSNTMFVYIIDNLYIQSTELLALNNKFTYYQKSIHWL